MRDALHIRNVDPELIRRLKVYAASTGRDLRDVVIRFLENGITLHDTGEIYARMEPEEGKSSGVETPAKKNRKAAKVKAAPVVEADPAPQYFGDKLPPNSEIEKVDPAVAVWGKDPTRTYLPDLATERAARKPLTKPGTKSPKEQ